MHVESALLNDSAICFSPSCDIGTSIDCAATQNTEVAQLLQTDRRTLSLSLLLEIGTSNNKWTRNMGHCPTWWPPCRI